MELQLLSRIVVLLIIVRDKSRDWKVRRISDTKTAGELQKNYITRAFSIQHAGCCLEGFLDMSISIFILSIHHPQF